MKGDDECLFPPFVVSFHSLDPNWIWHLLNHLVFSSAPRRLVTKSRFLRHAFRTRVSHVTAPLDISRNAVSGAKGSDPECNSVNLREFWLSRTVEQHQRDGPYAVPAAARLPIIDGRIGDHAKAQRRQDA